MSLMFTLALFLSLASVYFFLWRPAYVNQNNAAPHFPWFPPIGGEEVTIEQAQTSVPFKIYLPTKLGKPIQVKLDRYDNSLIIIWMESKPSPKANIYDVLNQGGIVLFAHPNHSTLEECVKSIEGAINATKGEEGALQKVNINGYVGGMGGNVGHCVFWYTETTCYELDGGLEFPLQQLLEIAQSIPVD
jgi:hypothetical protein